LPPLMHGRDTKSQPAPLPHQFWPVVFATCCAACYTPHVARCCALSVACCALYVVCCAWRIAL
jgi:hypothetical protein